MSWIYNNRRFFRIAVLLLFLVSLFGPWAFDLLNVPAQFPCGWPAVRLKDDFCGYPMSGFGAFICANSGFIYILDDLIRGNIAGRIPELISLIFTWIIILPFFSTLLLIWNKNSRRLQTINLIAWGLACIPALTLFILQTNRDELVHFLYLLWGVWLYILVAIGTFIFEILVLRSDTKPSRDI